MNLMENQEIEMEKDGAKYIFKNNKYFAYYQFGLQRTGTTIIERLIGDNFKLSKANDLIGHGPERRPPNAAELTWKHEIDVPEKLKPGLPLILNYKNPYLWLESMIYRQGAANGGWGNTYNKHYEIENQWERNKTRLDANNNGTVYPDQMLRVYRHWFETWINYYDNHQETTFLIKYEDLVTRNTRDAILDAIQQKFKWPEFVWPEYSWPHHCGSSQPMTKERVAYYQNGIPTQLEQRFIDMVPDIIGENLMNRLGYSIL